MDTTMSNPSVIKSLAAHEEAEMIASRGAAKEQLLVKPDYAYPNTRMNRDEMREEMKKPSECFHDLRLSSGNEIGLLRFEVLQCIGVPKLDAVSISENDIFCLAVCGSYAFKSDTIPSNANPMWLKKMRRACVFPLFHAYARLYVGAFSDCVNDRDNFAGRIVLDIARMRPDCTYDVTLPLRQSAHVYTKKPRGSVRVRFGISWYSERKAMLSYFNSKGAQKSQPDDDYVTVKCGDKKSFQNVALTVHGTHLQGRFSTTRAKALVREYEFTKIHVFRYLKQQEMRNLRGWQNPIISAFVFGAWIHSVYANTIANIPGHICVLISLYLWRNYANYFMNGSLQRGFLPPTWEEMLMALLFGAEGRHLIEPLEMTTQNDDVIDSKVVDKSESSGGSGEFALDEVADAFESGVNVSNNRMRLKVYRNTFTGSDAVDFLVGGGYATSRSEAVSLGTQLLKEKKLFEHVRNNKHDFKDGKHVYRFMFHDDALRICTTHEPRGKWLFRMLGMLDENRNLSENQLEMPFSNGKDYPRLTVKESLAIRLKDPKSMMSKTEHDMDTAEFDTEGSVADFLSSTLKRFDSTRTSDRDDDPSPHIFEPNNEVKEAMPYTVRELKKPPIQEIELRSTSAPILEVLAEKRAKIDRLLLRAFNDRTYVVKDVSISAVSHDKSHLNSEVVEEGSDPMSSVQKAKAFHTCVNWNNMKSQKRDAESTRDAKREEFDKILKTGASSISSRTLAKVGVIAQPMIEMGYLCLYPFRALFNIFTWQDPILTFWVSIICPCVATLLYLFPWRIFFGIAGSVLFGPQNWLIRVINERKGILPPDMDTVIVRKKGKADGNDEIDESEPAPLFCNNTDENRAIHYSALDQTNVKHIVIPYTPLMYNHRFYDWPPEPEYARVSKGTSQVGFIEKACLDTTNFGGSPENESIAKSIGRRNWRQVKAAVREMAPRPFVKKKWS